MKNRGARKNMVRQADEEIIPSIPSRALSLYLLKAAGWIVLPPIIGRGKTSESP